jgi:beta-glucosidase
LCPGGDENSKNGCEAEAHDRTTIELPGKQIDVALAMRAATKGPLVCVLVHGGAVALGAAAVACDAILDLWVPGQMTGAALADVIFGAVSPAGRSPITFYTSTADLPPMGEYNEYPHDGSNGTTYRYYRGAPPEFRFGDGLSYTSFAYSNLSAPKVSLPCDRIELSVVVRNTGARTSDEVVQVYASVPNATVPAPSIRLVAFQRVRDIAPGTEVVVKLAVEPESHAVVYPSMSPYEANLTIEAGPLHLSVGGSQPGPDTVKTVVSVCATAALQSCEPSFAVEGPIII